MTILLMRALGGPANAYCSQDLIECFKLNARTCNRRSNLTCIWRTFPQFNTEGDFTEAAHSERDITRTGGTPKEVLGSHFLG